MPRQYDVTKVNLKLEPHQVVLRPIVTEKGFAIAEHKNQYSFEVNRFANKFQIKDAVEKLFDVRVLEVKTQNRRGKKRRTRFGTSTTRSWKKAIVLLHEEDKINYF